MNFSPNTAFPVTLLGYLIIQQKMINHSLDSDNLILHLEAQGKLSCKDFEEISREIDPIIKKQKHLNGVMITASAFPRWENFDAISAHIRFVEYHHTFIHKLAFVSNDILINLIIPLIAKQDFLHPEIKIFETKEKALSWLTS